MRGIFLFPATLALLAACQTTSFDAGHGPLTLSARTMRNFELYATEPQPLAFAVSRDGRTAGYTVCQSQSCEDDGQGTALEYCRRYAKGSPCAVMAVGREIVWKGRVRYRSGQWLGLASNERPFVLYWDRGSVPWGARRQLHGVAVYKSDGKTADLSFAGKRSCVGSVTASRFTVSCAGIGAAAGSYAPAPNGLGGRGGATDAIGNIVELRVIPSDPMWGDRFRPILPAHERGSRGVPVPASIGKTGHSG